MKNFKLYNAVTSLILISLSALVGCGKYGKVGNFYIIKPGDTLYSVARKHKVSVQQLATVNKIGAPYVIHKGRRLIINNNSPNIRQVNKIRNNKIQQIIPNKTIDYSAINKSNKIAWTWPVKGKIIKSFEVAGPDKGNGIKIAGKQGEAVLSAASGKVVYAGNNLRGYGNLVIIKHNEEFLSAYAHNEKILVSEQQIVNKGQAIATMGKTDAKNVQLHFEIRYKGKPVDPLKIISRKH